ncbi:hypothetical protein C0R09_18455 [Brevibacillus laterosporus]|uniref:YopX family protein n=1 Tax=Brevibacillus laterosporus TaxID=1465 RepID=UPI000C76C647|nr:YopX family protein [Brevibacillus laterosporus]AUM66340.1 hypothetical protein C0R09_18455 [Brevibacillus laterosporus]
MREKKFQAWLTEEKRMLKWREFNLDIEDGYGGVIDYTQPKPKGNICDTATSYFLLRQYTGLHDKNGKEIYEGDIVLGRSEPATGTVEFSRGSIIVDWHGPDIDDLRDYNEFLEVIGNIYENPELTEESQ